MQIADTLMMTEENRQSGFYQQFKQGSFTSALRWHHLDALWEVIRKQQSDDWFIYAIGSDVPEKPVSNEELLLFIKEIDALLHQEHEEDYCGIVYADNLQKPTFVKIFDPNNLGVSCGYSDNPPLPGWVLSKLPPVDLVTVEVIPNNRKNWWKKLFS